MTANKFDSCIEPACTAASALFQAAGYFSRSGEAWTAFVEALDSGDATAVKAAANAIKPFDPNEIVAMVRSLELAGAQLQAAAEGVAA
ncbi:hypothetical protein [Lacipirellula sp.]|uniref:hypothetical protein n=1 Tax=Lacipirellula sp. TaxID=2691419 RepID=UPI003D0CFC9D